MKLLVALTLTACAFTRSALADAAAEAGAFKAQGAFFALSVADIEASSRWYSEKLGLKVTLKPPRSGPADVVVLEGNGLIVELIRHDAAVALDRLSPKIDDALFIHGYFKSGVIVEDFAGLLKTLEARGVTIAHGPYPAREGRRANVIVSDNAGNLIQFFGPAPG